MTFDLYVRVNAGCRDLVTCLLELGVTFMATVELRAPVRSGRSGVSEGIAWIILARNIECPFGG